MNYLVRVIVRDGTAMWLGTPNDEDLRPLGERERADVFDTRKKAQQAIARAKKTAPQSYQYEIVSA